MTDRPTNRVRLAIDGGAPHRGKPWPAWPVFGEEEIEAAAAVLRSGKVNYWTGQEGRAFEQEFAYTVDCRYGIALANGSVALELALAALGIGPGDEVVVTCRSFVASASCCAIRGATPIFADTDPASQNFTAESVRAVVSPRTKALVAVHLAGWPCEMDPIMELAKERNLAVIEDCAQAHGATYRGRPVGSLGHVAAFSFCQDKILTTGGEGGMLTTNDRSLWRRAWSFKDHGKDYDAMHGVAPGAIFKWVHDSIGTNWRMTEIQAALGRVLLGKLPGWVEKRRHLAGIFDDRLGRIQALRVTIPPPHFGHSYYKYYVFLRPEFLREDWSRDRIVEALRAEGIPCGSGTCPEIYLEKAFARSASRSAQQLPVARELGQTSLMLTVHPTLQPEDIHDACDAIEKVLRVAVAAKTDRLRRVA